MSQRLTIRAGNPNPTGPFVKSARPHAIYAAAYSFLRNDMSATVSVRQRSMSVTELLARTMISSDVAQMKPARSAALSPKKRREERKR